MRIWYRRPLFCVCTALMLGAAAGYLAAAAGLPVIAAGLILTGGCLLAGVCALIVRRRSARPLRYGRVFVWIILLCAAAGLAALRSGLYVNAQVREDTFASSPGAGPADEGPVWIVSGRVTERLSGGGQITVFGVTLDRVNGEKVGSPLHPCRAVLSCGYPSDLQPGYGITATVTPVPLADAAGQMAPSLTGDGYSVGLTSDEDTDCVISSESPAGLRGRLDSLRRRTATRLDLLVGKKGYGLPSALLLGERCGLDLVLQRDFNRSGVSHLLAISGLHMTMLFGLLDILMTWLTVPKRVRAVVLLVSSVGYLVFLGFPPSAARAVVMLGAVCLSRLWAADADPLTALGCAGALILTAAPCAAVDVGFWMSFSATLGLLTVTTVVRLPAPGGRKDKPAVRLLKTLRRGAAAVPSGIGAGIAAISFSLWVTAPVFGSVSLWSPLATLLLTPLCGCVLVLSIFLLPLSGTVLGQSVLLPAVRTLCGWMAALTGALSDASFGVLSLSGTAVTIILILMTATLLILLGVRLPDGRRWMTVLPAAAGWTLMIAAVLITASMRRDEVTVTCRQTSTGSEALILSHGQGAVICDLSDGSRTAMNRAVSQAEALGATEVSAVVLTHYHSRMPGTLYRLFATEKVRLLYLPSPATEDDWYLMRSVLEQADRAGVPVCLYDPSRPDTDAEALTLFGGVQLRLYADRLERSAQPVLLVSLTTNRNSLLYAGSAVQESGLMEIADDLLTRTDTVVFGRHGPLFRQSCGLPAGCRAELVCFLGDEPAAWFDVSSLPDETPDLMIGDCRRILYME